MVKTEPRKVTYCQSGTQTNLPTPLEFIPAECLDDIGKSLGDSVVKMAPPKGTINLRPRERRKTS